MTSAPASRCPLPPCPRGSFPTLRAKTFLGRGPQQLPPTIPRNPSIICKSAENASHTQALPDPVSVGLAEGTGAGGRGRAQPCDARASERRALLTKGNEPPVCLVWSLFAL